MATTVKIRRSGTATATPSALEHGEIAINYADGKVFWKDASNVITSFTFQSYALASHTHAASDITSGTLDAARLPLATTGAAGAVIVGTGLGVSSGTVSVVYGTGSGQACQGNDSRLSDTRTPTDGSVTTAKIADDAVTYAKIQNVSATSRILGRSSAGAGDVEELDAATARTVLSVQPTASPAFTGAATFANTANEVPLTVTNTGTGNCFVVNDASGDTTPFVIDASGRVGAGTTPARKLHVLDTDFWCARFECNNAIAAIVELKNTTTRTWEVGVSGSTSFGSVPAGSWYLYDISANLLRLHIDTSGTATFAGQIVGQAGAAISGGAVTVTSPLVLTGTVAGNVRQLRMQTSGSTRWEIGPGFDAESGSNVGSTFWITRWSDAGAFLGTPISIARATGAVTFESQLLVTAGTKGTCSVAPSGDGDTGIFFPAANQMAFSTNDTERMRIDASGNVRVNGADAATSAVGAIHIKNGTAPTASITDGVVLFAADVSTSELRVRDEAGNVTTLSPHAFPLIPDGPSEPMAWAYYSERDGRRINVDMLRVVRLLEQLTGEKLVYED